jgi:hypothetical protein
MSPVFATIAGGLMTKPNTDIYVSKGVYPPKGDHDLTIGSINSEVMSLTLYVGDTASNGDFVDWTLNGDHIIGNYDATTGKVTFEYSLDNIDVGLYDMIYKIHFEGYYYLGEVYGTEYSKMSGIWNTPDEAGGWHN